MFGYSGLKFVKFLLEGHHLNFAQWLVLLVASMVAFAVSMVVIKFLTNFVKKHDFTVFGWYRIVLGIVLLLYAAARVLLA